MVRRVSNREAVVDRELVVEAEFISRDVETRPKHVARVIDRRIHRNFIVLAAKKLKVSRHELIAGFHVVAAHVKRNLGAGLRAGGLILYGDGNLVDAAGRESRNDKAG